jgi:hypothetical protein
LPDHDAQIFAPLIGGFGCFIFFINHKPVPSVVPTKSFSSFFDSDSGWRTEKCSTFRAPYKKKFSPRKRISKNAEKSFFSPVTHTTMEANFNDGVASSTEKCCFFRVCVVLEARRPCFICEKTGTKAPSSDSAFR